MPQLGALVGLSNTGSVAYKLGRLEEWGLIPGCPGRTGRVGKAGAVWPVWAMRRSLCTGRLRRAADG